MIVRMIARLLAFLNSNNRAIEAGAGIAFGLLLALVPARNLVFPVLVLVVLLIKVNLGLTILAFLGFSTFVAAFDPLLSDLGRWILTRPGLQSMYVSIYATPIAPLTRFNDTLVMGSLAAGVVLLAPATGIGVLLVRLYRTYVQPRIANSKAVKAIMATPWAQKIARAVRAVNSVWPVAG